MKAPTIAKMAPHFFTFAGSASIKRYTPPMTIFSTLIADSPTDTTRPKNSAIFFAICGMFLPSLSFSHWMNCWNSLMKGFRYLMR